ncbi:MAG: precorrin-4 C(11)-methyltransferase [Chloroflexota bacterium]
MTSFDYVPQPGTIYFVSAGPGAPDLLTLRGKDIIAQADLILYADSLVEASVAQIANKSGARIIPSSSLHLEQMLALMVETAQADGVVARVHSGDTSLYGAIHEQMAYLEDYDLSYEIVPGVTSTFAAAAKLKAELTVPDIVQTIILTRTAGRTTMPEGENIRQLAKSGASLSIHLSVARIHKVVDDLLASGGYTPETPVAVLHKVTWPDESMVVGTLSDIVEKTREAGYTKHALILVSPALDTGLKDKDRRTSSHLYDKTYTHLFRKSEQPRQRDQGRRTKNAVVKTDAPRKKLAIITLTQNGTVLGLQLGESLQTPIMIPQKFAALGSGKVGHQVNLYSDSVLTVIRQAWTQYEQLLLIMPTGVAVRAIGPLLNNKAIDPAVVCLDERGKSVIPILGGHQAGANQLAQQVATLTGGIAAITTASDVQDKPALDLLGKDQGLRTDPQSALTHASACLVNDEAIGLYIAPEFVDLKQKISQQFSEIDQVSLIADLEELVVDAYQAGLIVSHRRLEQRHERLIDKSVLYHPPVLVVGVGCKKDVPADEIHTAIETTLTEAGLALSSIHKIATVDFKVEEAGLQAVAKSLDCDLVGVSQAQLASLPFEDFSPSAAQDKFGVAGVAEPSALLVSQGEIIVPKRSFERCTVAIALISDDNRQGETIASAHTISA